MTRDEIQAEVEKYKRNPILPPEELRGELFDTTMVEGMSLAEWGKLMEDFEAEEHRKRAHRTRIDHSKILVLDYGFLPGWVSWAVEKWYDAGCPTFTGALREKKENLLQRAERNEKEAAKAEEDAKAPKMKPKFVKLKLATAQKKRDYAAALRAEAAAIPV